MFLLLSFGAAARNALQFAGGVCDNDTHLAKEMSAVREPNSTPSQTTKTPNLTRHCTKTPKSSVRRSRLPMSEAKARGISFSLFRTVRHWCVKGFGDSTLVW